MNVLANVPVHDGKLFKWKSGIGFAEASDLPPGWVRKVWADSLDEGFYVRSHRTGELKLYLALEDIHDDGEGLVSWIFESQDGYSIEIFND